jgi:hypothetical protein
VILAAISPDNTPHGYNWTFAFPMLLFIVVALILYALFSRPHRRVPGRVVSATHEPGGSSMTGSVHLEDLDSRQGEAGSPEGRSPEGRSPEGRSPEGTGASE